MNWRSVLVGWGNLIGQWLDEPSMEEKLKKAQDEAREWEQLAVKADRRSVVRNDALWQACVTLGELLGKTPVSVRVDLVRDAEEVWKP